MKSRQAEDRRLTDGAPTSPSPVRSPDPEKRGRKNKGKKEGGKRDGVGTGGDSGRPSLDIQVQVNGSTNNIKAASGAQTPPANGSVPPTPAVEGAPLDPMAKKVRNLTKKLKAIEELKEKAKKGERLEATQVKKIDTEAEIRRELAGLGISA
ncbi:hypothetical protein NLI96_g9586 [Meripilus lineatus]|uniref:WIBG Mago-binding domain-containing protein n=1 Tax=Meripilus lineatus TaxID=2056292 RepID=A0AAD5YCS4_9APHY|nr:hypothetical protein NLI96_g9586 [Physisporinus lineatus]